MFRKQLSPRAVAIVAVLLLAAIQFIYWRLLVYHDVGPGAGPGSPMPGGGGARVALGRQDVEVTALLGGGPGYQDGPAWRAQMCGPADLALEPGGTLLVADSRNHRIRRLTPAGTVTTVAGGAAAGGPGGRSDGPVLQAQFRYPAGVAAGPEGTIYVADTGNHRICRIRSGRVETMAGGAPGRVDGAGPAARFRFPGALTLQDGVLWVNDLGNGVVRRVTPDGAVSTASDPPASVRAALGDLPTAAAGEAVTASPDGEGQAEATEFRVARHSPSDSRPGEPGIFADPQTGVVLVRQPGGGSLLLAGRMTSAGVLTGSNDGPGHRASFQLPCAVAVGPGGVAYVADYEGNQVRRLQLPEWLTASTSAPPSARRRSQRDWESWRQDLGY